jgi:predicted Zn-dependent protease
MALPTKEELGDKLGDYPLLRVLLYERWFRLAFLAFALVFVFLALFLPKIWRTSRTGFMPVVKVSGLDLVQAWSLQRTARKAMAAGKFDEANYAWQAALANNRADPALVRGALGCVMEDPGRPKNGDQAIREAFWLLRLTGTNLVDLELAAQVFDRYKYYESIITLVQPRSDQMTPILAGAYLKALFSQGRIQEFDRLWNDYSRKFNAVRNDPDLKLYRDAYLVGWGPADSVTAARQELDRAMDDPNRRLLACRLKLALSTHQMNAAEYNHALQKLAEWHEDSLSYHIGYWAVLLATGQRAEAARLLQAYPERPTTALELAELAQLYLRLGMRDEGLKLLQRSVTDFGQVPIFWVTYADLLADAKRWEELRNLAVQIRSQDAVRDPLAAFSYFLEGRAELALGRDSTALAAFQKASDRDCPYPGLALRMASQLLEFGHANLARPILARLEKPLKDDPAYWLLVFKAADKEKDVKSMVSAATRCYELTPHEPMAINNYAAALLIGRQNPQDAIRLTIQLLSENPNSVYAMVNHSAALLLNERASEAEALLHRVRTNQLDRAQSSIYYMDLFETYYRLRQFDRAWSYLDRIETNLLYPTQQQWLKQTRQQLPPRQKQKG